MACTSTRTSTPSSARRWRRRCARFCARIGPFHPFRRSHGRSEDEEERQSQSQSEEVAGEEEVSSEKESPEEGGSAEEKSGGAEESRTPSRAQAQGSRGPGPRTRAGGGPRRGRDSLLRAPHGRGGEARGDPRGRADHPRPRPHQRFPPAAGFDADRARAGAGSDRRGRDPRQGRAAPAACPRRGAGGLADRRGPPSSSGSRRSGRRPASPRRLPAGIWALGLGSMFMDASSELVHSLLPLLMVGVLGASMVTVGIVEGVAEATAAITKVFSGALSDYLGRRKFLLVLGY